MLKLEGLSKSFGGRVALSNVDFFVPGGATHALIGSSGSGKTTLLRIILGLLTPDRGSIQINEKNLSQSERVKWADQIGYVPQEAGLFPHLTARENVVLAARIKGWPEAKRRDRLGETRQLAGLEEALLDRFPQELSGGQRQRVAIMRAAVLDPPVFLLDEPMGALDPIVRQALQEEFKGIFKKLNKTVVLVTHDLGEAVFLSDRMTLLHEGKTVQTGTYEDFARRPATPFVSLFMKANRSLPDLEPA
jgi:osmoprotectant transport system ATP-binding protein